MDLITAQPLVGLTQPAITTPGQILVAMGQKTLMQLAGEPAPRWLRCHPLLSCPSGHPIRMGTSSSTSKLNRVAINTYSQAWTLTWHENASKFEQHQLGGGIGFHHQSIVHSLEARMTSHPLFTPLEDPAAEKIHAGAKLESSTVFYETSSFGSPAYYQANLVVSQGSLIANVSLAVAAGGASGRSPTNLVSAQYTVLNSEGETIASDSETFQLR